jgi:hypothetical protein
MIVASGERAGRGQVGPCLTDAAHRPLPERRPCVSRYAGARTLQQRSLRQILQVESSYLLCSKANATVGLIITCVVLPNLSSISRTTFDMDNNRGHSNTTAFSNIAQTVCAAAFHVTQIRDNSCGRPARALKADDLDRFVAVAAGWNHPQRMAKVLPRLRLADKNNSQSQTISERPATFSP